MAELEARWFSAHIECRYLVHIPDEAASGPFVIALHGYGMDAETMLRLARTWFPEQAIASVEAPCAFYRDLKTREVGYCWATHTRSEESVRLHHEMLLRVLEELGVPVERRLLLGFSQPVGLNYRFAATHPGAVRGVIGVCGGVPKDWETGPYQPVEAALLHIARTDDEAYPIETARLFGERLAKRARNVEFLELEGKHRFPSLAAPAVLEWVKKIFD